MTTRILYFFIAVAAATLSWLVHDEFISERLTSFSVFDSESNQPIVGATILAGDRLISTNNIGTVIYVGPRLREDQPIAVKASGYEPQSVLSGERSTVAVRLQPTLISGRIVDSSNSEPIAGAMVVQGTRQADSGLDGSFRVQYIDVDQPINFDAPGYVASTLPFDSQPMQVRLQPRVITVEVFSDRLGLLRDAVVVVGENTGHSDQSGMAKVSYVEPGQVLSISAPDHEPVSAILPEGSAFRMIVRYNVIAGRVVDKHNGRPIPNATVITGQNEVRTDGNGEFRVGGAKPDLPIFVRASNYAATAALMPGTGQLVIELEKESIRAIYLTFYGIGSPELRNNALRLIEETELNAIVIDVKGDRGWVSYKSALPAVQEYGAQPEITIPDPEALLADLRGRGIYTIARIVLFKDDPLSRARPDLAVMDSETGKQWVDGEGLGWADPTRREVWEYNVAIAKEAAELGFDEIQFDYIRFPSDPAPGTNIDRMVFSKQNTQENRIAAISGFLEYARSILAPTGVRLAVDVFGYTSWRDDDMGIGQQIEAMAPHVDVISTMVYPNLFFDGIPAESGILYRGEASLHPYEIVHESIKQAQQRLSQTGVTLRPWLQYYDDYILDNPYGPDEFHSQKQALYDLGLGGWMFWDPGNQYAKGGFEPDS